MWRWMHAFVFVPTLASAQPILDPTDRMRMRLAHEEVAELAWSTSVRGRLDKLLIEHRRWLVSSKCSATLCIFETELISGEEPPRRRSFSDDIGRVAKKGMIVHVKIPPDHKRITVFVELQAPAAE